MCLFRFFRINFDFLGRARESRPGFRDGLVAFCFLFFVVRVGILPEGGREFERLLRLCVRVAIWIS